MLTACDWCYNPRMKNPLVLLLALAAGTSAAQAVVCTGDFAAAHGLIAEAEKAARSESCLNGRWQFQPLQVPATFPRGHGVPPELPMPDPRRWEDTPIKIPSPWNVNAWGCGRNVGEGTEHPYWPDSIYFPSYPAAWDGVEMGWLRRSFRVPADWSQRRVVLHFEAVAGDCRVFVNGQPAGAHFDKYLPFELDVTRLLRHDADNELLVGVRSHALFESRSPNYPKMRAPFPTGSETEKLVGIWQDVFLLGLPAVRVDDVFVQPLVDRDMLRLDVTVRNDGDTPQRIDVAATVTDSALRLEKAGGILLAPGTQTNIVLQETVRARLKTWSPDAPNLHEVLVTLRVDGREIDRKATRFGWRQFTLAGKDLLLNGQKIQLTGDLLHPFGPFIFSRDFVAAWYQLIKDVGGNAVRPHAQPHPRHYLDLADEMGLVVLDETALFGSSVALNFEDPAAWPRFEAHYDGLILRDRNHPCIVGWSFGNELFAIFALNNVGKDDADRWYRRLAELGLRARTLDPTRPWISCDGDEDLRGTLPVWSKHFGHGTPLDRLPEIDKPLMVGESGGTYYARPKQMAEFNGARAYESYAGRNEALAIDVYENIVNMARPRLAYYSASETAWFGVEHLNFGYTNFARRPGTNDGVFFTKPFAEDRPGMQPERIPPFVATLNPGWDPALPVYKPLAMFAAQKAALAQPAPQPLPWSRAAKSAPRVAATGTIDRVAFVGDRNGPLARRLVALGVPLGERPAPFLIVDGETCTEEFASLCGEAGTTVLWLAGGTNLLVSRTDRSATALVPDAAHPWTAGFTLPDLYFAEDGADRLIVKHGLMGPLVDGGRVLLRASDTDWSLFNEAPENAKCAAVVLYEKLAKPSGAVLVECTGFPARVTLCSVDYRVASRTANAFWRRLLANAGIRLGEPANAVTPAFDENGALVNAQAVGRFAAASVDEAFATDFLAEGRPAWQPVTCPSRDRFILRELKQAGPEQGAFAVYLRCWVRSPRALDDLLADGPDAPKFNLFCYVADRGRLFVNGREILPARNEPADYRSRLAYEGIPLKKGWNEVVFKVASAHLDGTEPATLAVRMHSNDDNYLRQLETAVESPR